MKIRLQKRQSGSVLLWMLIVGLTAGITLASYLTLISNRYKMTTRSMEWNQALPVLEAGIEEAMTHINDDSSISANGWTASVVGGAAVNTKLRTNSDGSYYSVAIYNGATTSPIIYSSGLVPATFGKGYITRIVKVTGTRPQKFSAAVAANGEITVSGSGSTIDSYSSCAGPYSSSNSLGTNAILVTNSRGNPAFNFQNGHLYGTADTGPGGTITGNGIIGSDAYNLTNGSGNEKGWTNDNFNQNFGTNSAPTNTASWLAPGTVTNATVLTGGNYKMSSFTSSDNQHPMLISGPSVLYVTGDFTVQGSGFVEVLPGGSLTVYVGGSTTTVSGGGFINKTGSPENFTYIGLGGNTTMTYSGGSDIVGTINAPQANVTISGGASLDGAAIGNTFTISGGSSVHYDTCSAALGALVMTSWQETQ